MPCPLSAIGTSISLRPTCSRSGTAILQRRHGGFRTHKGAATHKTKTIDLSDPEAARRRKVSANRILGLLKAALNYAFAEGKAASDIEWRRVKPFKDVNQSRASYLSLAECKRLLNAAIRISVYWFARDLRQVLVIVTSLKNMRHEMERVNG